MLKIGVRGQHSVDVNRDNTARAAGSGTLEVFSTPAMIALMEKTACDSVAGLLDPGQSTVGSELHIRHISPTPVGMTVACVSELVEIDRRRLVFTVEVSDKTGIVGSGTHERFIIDTERFMEKAAAKTEQR